MNKIFKVILTGPGPNDREAIIIKHYIDLIYPCFEKLKDKIFARFPFLKESSALKMYWIDNEGDKISMYTEEDFRLYLDHEEGGKIFIAIAGEVRKEGTVTISMPTITLAQNARANVNSNANVNKDDLAFHTTVVCDGCEGEVRGFRYKCVQCKDFDLCMSCEGKMMHKEHSMYRIVEPQHDLNERMARSLFKLHRKGRLAGNRPESMSCRRGHRKHEYNEFLTELQGGVKGTYCKQNNEHDPYPLNDKASEMVTAAVDMINKLVYKVSSHLEPFGLDISIEPIDVDNKTAEKKTEKKAKGPKTDPKPMEKSVNNEAEPSVEIGSTEPSIASVDHNDAEKPLIDTSVSTSDSSIKSNQSEAAVGVTAKSSSPIPDWTLVDDTGVADDEPVTQGTGTIPKTQGPSPSKASQTGRPQMDYAALSRHLRERIEYEQAMEAQAAVESSTQAVHEAAAAAATAAATATTAATAAALAAAAAAASIPEAAASIPEAAESIAINIPAHLRTHIKDALIAMTNMGFSNEGGWLIQLLESVNGDIPKSLDLLMFNK